MALFHSRMAQTDGKIATKASDNHAFTVQITAMPDVSS